MRYAIRKFEGIGSQFAVIPRILLWFIIIIIPIPYLGCDRLPMRKEIPFQEVVPLDRGIAVINAGRWYQDKLEISLGPEGGKTQRKFYDKKGVCVFGDLTNGTEYTVEIKRTDVKGMLLYRTLREKVRPLAGGTKYVVLVGASVGKAWEFPRLPKRMEWDDGIVLGFRCKYDFDKSDEIKALAELPIPVSSVIIKECAAYFPRDVSAGINQIKGWVEELKGNGITPVLATVVPVTRKHDSEHPGRMASIQSFNDEVRAYALETGLGLLDLEKALRKSDEDRHLRDEYAHPDGLHLNNKTYYEVLDPLLPLIARAPEEKASGISQVK